MIRLNSTQFSSAHSGGNTELIINVRATIIFKGRARIGCGCRIMVDNKGSIVFGDDVVVNNQNNRCSTGTIILGDRVTIGHQNQIFNTNFHFTISSSSMEVSSTRRDIELGENVWIPNRVTILRGVRLAPNTIVCSNSLVTKSVKDQGVMISGIPAKKLLQNYYPIINNEAASQLNHYFNSNPSIQYYTWHGELSQLIKTR